MIKILLVVILIVMLSGGIIYYYYETRKLAKAFKDFMLVTFEALKDKKLTIAEKELILKKYTEMSPYAQSIKTKFIDDAKELVDDVKEIYANVKKKIKE